MKVDAISFRRAGGDMPVIQARIGAGFDRMEPLADESGRPINFAPSEDMLREAVWGHSMADLDRRVTEDVERAQRAMVRLRGRFPVI